VSDEGLPELFADALELDDEGRRALVAELRRHQPGLADELGRLLAIPESAGSPIDRSAAAALGFGAAGLLPESIGPYRIVRELGQGGMGMVFLADH